jgi:hypothetical protein
MMEKLFPELDVYPSSQVTTCVAKVEPTRKVVSLLDTVTAEQATGSQSNTSDQPETPGPEPEHVAMNEVPEEEV